jgi:hypothetical protein
VPALPHPEVKHVATPQPDAADAPDRRDAPDGPDAPDGLGTPDGPDAFDDADPDAGQPLPDGETEPEDGRSPETEALWAEVRIDPVMIALPPDLAGYTLRAYRSLRDLTPTDTTDRPAEETDLFAVRRTDDPEEVDEEELLAAFERSGGTVGDEPDEIGDDDTGRDDDRDAAVAADDDGAGAEPDELDEEVPIFLSHKGRLLLFVSPESLVDFIRSDAPHDLAQLDSWATLAGRVGAADIVPAQDDTYELDLVVDNLRGTHDAWDLPLLISAGELARDLGYALQLPPVITALASGSPLDDLDEALRAAGGGGVGGFMGRRRLRKIGTQQASLGWRTIIGKISAAVDWRE